MDNSINSGEDEVDAGMELKKSKTDGNLAAKNVRFEGNNTIGGRYCERKETSYTGELFVTMAHHYGHSDRADSWQNTVFRRRKDGNAPKTEQEATEEIADAMANDKMLSTDHVDGQVRRRDALRDLTQSLTMKKQIKEKLKSKDERKDKSKKISRFKRFRYDISIKRHNFMESIKAQLHDYSLWHSSLKEIEGRYGTGIGSYFKFLRTLFILNTFVSLVVLSFLILPQSIYSAYHTEPTINSTVSPLKKHYVGTNDYKEVAERLRVSDDESPSNVIYDSESRIGSYSVNSSDFKALDWLTGAGWFGVSEAFYGAYSSEYIFDDSYNMLLCYFFTIGCSFFIYLGFLVRKVIKVYKDNYIDIDNEVGMSFVKIVFCGWDFNVTDEKASNLQHRRIYTELRELLEKCKEEEIIDSSFTRILNYIPKLVGWALLIGLLVGMYYLADFIQQTVMEDLISEDDSYILNSLGLLIYPCMANLVLYTVPVILQKLVVFERYKKMRNAVYATLLRATLVELVVVGVLIASWFTPNTSEENDNDSNKSCWENSLGQEIYRLLLVDFIFFLITSAAFSILLCIFNQKSSTRKYMQDFNKFNIARNTFHLIYNLTLMWVGFFFCPVTPIIVTIKFFIIFYIQKGIAINLLYPDDRPCRAAQMETFFLSLTLASLILGIISFCFIIFKGHSSPECGPFIKGSSYISQINDAVGDDGTIIRIISFILKPGMVASILGILLIVVYCMRSVAQGRAEMVLNLRKQLEIEMIDRTFLVKITDRLQSGHHTMDGHRIPSPRSPVQKRNDMESRQLTRRSSSFFTPNRVHPEERRQSGYSYKRDNSREIEIQMEN